jgi:TRAP-type C4-dicarboxylate transport system permease small subunit
MVIRSINMIIRIFDKIAAIVMGLIVAYVTIHALLRYTIGGGLPSEYPIVQNLLVIIVFASLAQAQVEKQHIRIDFLKNLLPETAKKLLDSFVYIVAAMFLFLLVWGSKMSFQEALAIREYFTGSINISTLPARLAVLLGSLFLLVQFIVEIIQAILVFKSSKKYKHI